MNSATNAYNESYTSPHSDSKHTVSLTALASTELCAI
jgi:hypothetical protein